MKRESIGTVQELGDILSRNASFANGKNRPLDHLYSTGARSRFAHENIYGVYFTNEGHAWMALWMAVTDRAKVRKRNITYVRPWGNDAIGSIAVYSPDASLDVFCDDGAFIYLVDSSRFRTISTLDLTFVPSRAKEFAMRASGFVQRTWERRGESQKNYFYASSQPSLIRLDDWQVAFVNIERIVPDIEVFIRPECVLALKERVIKATSVSDEKYIVDAYISSA